MNLITFLILLVLNSHVDGWELFATVKFKPKLFEKYNHYFLVPQFSKSVRGAEGKDIELKGHYLPVDLGGNRIVISKNPFAACFFCGGAGPETVAEVNLSSKLPRLKADQVIQVRGKLKLNATDVEHMCFILENAELIE